ncbi:hypothetical protein [Streptomyces hokutonensis]|uniref:Uncharacterized protein n=1 Tax=Streptomyces hokutonensis TaxID=1306990 RepID=A0ABW6LZC8_9ACTN
MTQPDPFDRRIQDSIDLHLTRAGGKVDAQLVGFVRWYQLHSRGAPDEESVGQDLGLDPGKWGAVGRAAIVLGLAQAGLPTEGIMSLYAALAGVEDVQAAMLKSLDKKASLLLDGPLRTAQLLVHEAERIGLSDARYAATLQRAWDRFFDAYGLAGSPQSRAVVQMHLGQVSLLLGRREDAAHWLMESYRCAREAIEVLAAGSNDGRVLRSKWGTAASVVYYPVGVAVFVRKVGRIRKAQHALQATRSYVEFVNAVAASANAVSTNAIATGLSVEQITLNEFAIREVRTSS